MRVRPAGVVDSQYLAAGARLGGNRSMVLRSRRLGYMVPCHGRLRVSALEFQADCLSVRKDILG